MFFFAIRAKRDRHMPAQPRTGNAAVEIVEGQPVAGERYARGQADIPRQRVRRFEIEQRPEIGAANFQGQRWPWPPAPMAPPCLRRRHRAPSPEIFAFSRSDAPHAPVAEPSNCAGPSPAAIVRSSPSSASRRTALLRRQLRLDAEFAASQRLRDRCLWIAATQRLRGDRGEALELRRVDIDHGARIGRDRPVRRSCRARARV